jgi:hypothetical protein
MARFSGANIDDYGSQNNSNGVSFFTLKNDKDVARIRVLYNGAEDVDGYSTHRVQVGDKERDVNCLRENTDPIDMCPFCKSRKYPVSVKLYIPIYNEDTGEVQLWGRGRKFYSQITGICSRYPNTVSRVFDVERNGAVGDKNTSYNFYPIGDADGTTIEDILEEAGLEAIPDPIGTVIMDKTAEEMENYLQTGEFSSEAVPSRRNSERSEEPSRMSRRTSARGRGDRF